MAAAKCFILHFALHFANCHLASARKCKKNFKLHLAFSLSVHTTRPELGSNLGRGTDNCLFIKSKRFKPRIQPTLGISKNKKH